MENVWLTEILIVLAFLAVAILHSSVGHGGASGYLAVMAVLAVSPTVIGFKSVRRLNRIRPILSRQAF